MITFPPELLECLAAVIEEGSFDKAARRLSITQPAVSQRIRALETLTGTVLVIRSRPLRPTPAGKLLLKHTMQMRLLGSDLQGELKNLSSAVPTAHLGKELVSVAVNADSIATWALPALDPPIRQGAPLEIIADDQDFTQEWLREGRVLGCVTTLNKPMRGCKIFPLGAMEYVAVSHANAIVNYCAGQVNAHNVSRLPFIAFNRKDDLQTEFVCHAFKLRRVQLRQHYVPSSEGQVRAVLAGWGASVVPELLVDNLISEGILINIAPDARFRINLYWHCWNIESTLLDILTAGLLAAARDQLTRTK